MAREIPETPEKRRFAIDPATAATADPEAIWLRDVYQPDAPNLTVRAVVAGVLIGFLMCLSNLYVFFKTGWSLGVTLTACILAFAVFQGLRAFGMRPLGALENNALTTVASGAGYMTGGGNMAAYGALLMVVSAPVVATAGAMDATPGVPQMMLWFAVIAMMGVFVAIPIKRQLVNREALAFPTGTATAETIRVIHEAGGSGGRVLALVISALIAALLKTLISVFKWVPETLKLPVDLSGHALASWSLYLKTEVVLIAAGALMSFRTGWSLLVGGLATYGILAPWLYDQGLVTDVSYKGIVAWTLWPGAAILVAGGLTSFALDYKSLVRAFAGVATMFSRKSRGAETGIAAVEAPIWWFPAAFLFLSPIIILLMAWLFGIPAWAGVIAVILAILMGFVAARVTGETDITPTKALGPVTQITFGAINPGNLAGNIMSANVTGGIGLHGADLLTTLKTGWLLGAKPRHQLYAQLFGVVAGAIFIVPAFRLIIPDPSVLGDTEWPAPSCVVWEGVSRAFARGLDSLDDSIKVGIAIGAGLGFVLALFEKLASRRVKAFVPSANGLGIAMVIPGANCISMFIGALIAWILQKYKKDQMVIPVASGLIAGESLMGIAVAMLVAAGVVAK